MISNIQRQTGGHSSLQKEGSSRNRTLKRYEDPRCAPEIFSWVLIKLMHVQTRNRNTQEEQNWTPLELTGDTVAKNLPANAGHIRDVGSISGLGRSSGGGMATHFSILAWESPWAQWAWRATVHGVTKSQTWLPTEYTHTQNSQRTINSQSEINHY